MQVKRILLEATRTVMDKGSFAREQTDADVSTVILFLNTVTNK